MDALTRCATLADLLWPDVGADITLRSNPPAVDVTVRAMRDGRLLTSLDDVTAADALAALAAHLEEIARGRVASLRAAGIDAPSPVPSRDELAARLAECERELADVTRSRDAVIARCVESDRELTMARDELTAYGAAVGALAAGHAPDIDGDNCLLSGCAVDALRRVTNRVRAEAVADEALSRLRSALATLVYTGAADVGPVLAGCVGEATANDLRTLAARSTEHSALVDRYGAAVLRLAERDREPPQRAPGVVAGVAADVVDGWRVALLRATRGVGDVLDVCIAMGDAVAEARQRAGGGEGRGERVEGAQQGAADVGGVAERVVVAEGVAELFAGGACISGDGIRVEVVSMLEHVVREHGGQRVRVVVEVLRGEGGSVHSESVSPTPATREAP